MRKLLSAVFVLLGVVVLVFFMFRAFGDPAQLLTGQSADKKTTENIRKELHLDKSLPEQLLLYINDVSPIAIHSAEEIESKQLKGFFAGGERKIGVKLPYLGKSYQTKQSTSALLFEALPGTLVLAAAAMLIAIFAGVSLGLIAAVKKDTVFDTAAIFTSIAGISAPSFFVAIVFAYLFGYVLHDHTGLSITGSLFDTDEITGERFIVLRNLILPAITLGIRPMAIIAQITRTSMLDILNRDFIRTAYAKGLTRRAVVLKHALPNALNPVITTITGWFAELLAGAFFVEYIFGWKGIGKVTVDALGKLDYPVVAGAVLLSALIFVCVNIFSDLVNRMIDPRIA